MLTVLPVDFWFTALVSAVRPAVVLLFGAVATSLRAADLPEPGYEDRVSAFCVLLRVVPELLRVSLLSALLRIVVPDLPLELRFTVLLLLAPSPDLLTVLRVRSADWLRIAVLLLR